MRDTEEHYLDARRAIEVKIAQLTEDLGFIKEPTLIVSARQLLLEARLAIMRLDEEWDRIAGKQQEE